MLLHCWWECKLIQPLWKMVRRFLKKLGIKPPYDPAIPLVGIYPEETKIEKDTCIPLFIAALFTIARTWKQPRFIRKIFIHPNFQNSKLYNSIFKEIIKMLVMFYDFHITLTWSKLINASLKWQENVFCEIVVHYT